MDTLSLQLFVRVAELGGIAAAARDLSLAPASASARLSKLEDSIGRRLFNRTTRAVALTTDGSAFLPYAQDALETLEAGISTLRGEDHDVRGTLRITMPGSFGRMHIIPLLDEFLALHPHIRLDLRLSDQVLDAVKGAFDLVIRNAPVADSSLVARKLATDKRLLVASPSYLQRSGTPGSPRELALHRSVSFPNAAPWKFQGGQQIEPSYQTAVNDGEAMRDMLEAGMGIGVKSLWNVYRSLQTGQLVEVLPNYPLVTESAIWAIYPGGRMVSPKVRAIVDFLVEKFSPIPPWEKLNSDD